MLDKTALERKLEKLMDKLEEDFVDEVRKLKPEQLKEKAIGYAKELERIEDEKKAHAEYQAAKSALSDLNKGFNETKKYAKLRMQFVLAVMQEKGLE
jgi:hypothetical protein